MAKLVYIPLTDSEWRQRAEEHATVCRDIANREAELKAHAKAERETIKELKEREAELRRAVLTRHEERRVEGLGPLFDDERN